METKKTEKITYNISGESAPTTDDLIEILTGLKEMIPVNERNTLRIEKVDKGSIIIDAILTPLINLFGQEEFSLFWDNLDKILMLIEAGTFLKGGSTRLINRLRKKSSLTMNDVKELLEVLNQDKNSYGKIITHNDFKDLKKVSSIVKKRGEMTVYRNNKEKQIITKDAADIIIKICDADVLSDEEIEYENLILHLKISRVSFEGQEKWKARILEDGGKKSELIEIEDIQLLNSVHNGQLSFSGNEVVEADVRIETTTNTKRYYLVKYIDIAPITKVNIK